jgi:hypothetical protein
MLINPTSNKSQIKHYRFFPEMVPHTRFVQNTSTEDLIKNIFQHAIYQTKRK